MRSKKTVPRAAGADEYVPWQIALLALLTFAVFLPTLRSGFVYDARLQILTDPFIHDAANWWDVLSFRVLGRDVLDFNRPVHLAFLMLDSAIWGINPFGYHLTSILLHTANTVLLYLVIRALLLAGPGKRPGFPATPAPFLCALLFGVHPLMTEAVCEPTYREDLLAVFFSLSALLLAIGHRNDSRRPDFWRTGLCAAACLLAVASKETGIVAPLLLACYWIMFRRHDRPDFWIWTTGLGIFLTGLFFWLRFFLATKHSVIFETDPSYPGGTFASAMALMPRILVLYLQNLVWPTGLCADYGFLSIAHLNPVFCLWLLVALALAGAAGLWKSPLFALAVFCAVLPLLPVANLIPIYRVAADRYLYFPMVGISLALAALLSSQLLQKRRGVAVFVTVAFLATLPVYAGMNIRRQEVWADPVALWRDTYGKNPNSPTAAGGLGEALWLQGNLEESAKLLREANRLEGGQGADTLALLAVVNQSLGFREESARYLQLALQADPRLSEPDKRVDTLALTRDEAEAIKKLLAPPKAED